MLATHAQLFNAALEGQGQEVRARKAGLGAL
jgi:hypothetical protein